jgi:hypothetical protein
LNHAIVITEERFATFILNKRFSKTFTLFKIIYLLPYFTCYNIFLRSLCSLWVKLSKLRKYRLTGTGQVQGIPGKRSSTLYVPRTTFYLNWLSISPGTGTSTT